jgi:hypothetical protein
VSDKDIEIALELLVQDLRSKGHKCEGVPCLICDDLRAATQALNRKSYREGDRR